MAVRAYTIVAFVGFDRCELVGRRPKPHVTKHLGRVGPSMGEGDVVFTERFAPALKDPMGQTTS